MMTNFLLVKEHNMDLFDLGFDDTLQQAQKKVGRPELSAARVTRVDRERYVVQNGTSEVPGEPTGKILFSAESGEDLPCVGDWVLVQYYNDDTLAIIHEVLPRKSVLRRKAAGKKVDTQIIASNIDCAIIMQSCDHNFNVRRLERYLVMAYDGKIQPVILLSKRDLVDDNQLEAMLNEIRSANIGATVVPFSNTTGQALQDVQNLLAKQKTYCLLGSSGVGKTTLLNQLIGREEFETAAVRENDSRGRHTTVRRQLIVLQNGALLIDTPGMRELGMLAANDGIEQGFTDITSLAGNCRFTDCTHTKEAGCAILQAVEEGEISSERYHSFMKLKKESDFYGMSYAERRRKDRQFGKMVKTSLKLLEKHKPSDR